MKIESNYYVYEYIDPKTNIPFYVGKGKNDRYLYHLKNLNDNTNLHKVNKIKKILSEGGEPIIKLVKTGLTETQSFDFEKKLIEKYGRIDLENGSLVNLSDGGEGQSGWIPSGTYKAKMSELSKGCNNGMFGKKHNEETKNKIREKSTGRKFTILTKKKMSENKMGKNNSFYGKKHKKETIELIRQKKVGRFTGEKNFTAKIFMFITPNNEKKIVKGGFIRFCEKNNLSIAKMRRYIDKGIIPKPKKNPQSMTVESENCIGWEVKIINPY